MSIEGTEAGHAPAYLNHSAPEAPSSPSAERKDLSTIAGAVEAIRKAKEGHLGTDAVLEKRDRDWLRDEALKSMDALWAACRAGAPLKGSDLFKVEIALVRGLQREHASDGAHGSPEPTWPCSGPPRASTAPPRLGQLVSDGQITGTVTAVEPCGDDWAVTLSVRRLASRLINVEDK